MKRGKQVENEYGRGEQRPSHKGQCKPYHYVWTLMMQVLFKKTWIKNRYSVTS